MSFIRSSDHQSDSYSGDEAASGVKKGTEPVSSSAGDGYEKDAFSCCEGIWERHSDVNNFDSDIEENGPGDDDEEEEEDGIYDSTSIPKLQFRNDIWEARWNEDLSMAEVLKNKGKMATTTGIIRKGKLFCSIEETLYLSERGALSLGEPNDHPIPLKGLYKRISGQASWELFEAYRHLKSLGYIVVRHGVSWTMKSNKNLKPTSVHEAALAGISPTEERLQHNLSVLALNDNTHSGELSPDFDVYLPNSKFRKSSPGNPSFKLHVCRGLPPSKHDIKILESKCEGIPLKICHVDHGRVSYLAFNEAQLEELP